MSRPILGQVASIQSTQFNMPQQVLWTGQPRRTTGLERLGFYCDTWAALRAGLRTAPCVGLPGRATRRAAGPRCAQGNRTALRTGPQGCATRRAAGRAARRTNYSATAPPAGPSDQRADDADTYQWTSRPRAPRVYSRNHVTYAGTTLGGLTWTAGVYTLLDRTTRAASSACTW